LFSGVLEATGRRDFDVGTGLTIKVGNAGVLALAINGQPGRPLGETGEVVTVNITPENLRDFLPRS
jgi:hypothetical protein